MGQRRIKQKNKKGIWVTMDDWQKKYAQLADHLRPVVLKIDEGKRLAFIRPKTIMEVAAQMPKGGLQTAQMSATMDRAVQASILSQGVKKAENILKEIG